MNTTQSIDTVKGVGPKTAQLLSSGGVRTVGDLITYFPKRHETFLGVQTIDAIKPGKVTIKATCESVSTRMVRRGMKVTTAVFADATGKVKAVWFNQAYREKQLTSKQEFYVTGVFEFSYNSYQLKTPSVERASDIVASGTGCVPIYRAIKGIKSETLLKMIASTRPLVSVLPEVIPQSIVDGSRLMSYSDAVLAMHFPKDEAQIAKARRRLAFDELLSVLVASACNKQEHTRLHGYHIPFDAQVVREFVERLPFSLTGAQRRVAWDIMQDFEKKTPMNRLVQGDVGSGKTVVAGIAARMAAHEGYQTALMAPTEILARQHAETLQNLLAESGVTVGLLVGAVKGKARKELYERIADGSVDIVVGTQAIIQEKVVFKRLGFAIIDEQHRFGVEQRQKLLAKGEHMPHLLALTATPIPRSLALTVYGELDVSVINERPAHRLPIKTKIVSPVSKDTVYATIDAEIAKGRQVYVICPLIEESDTSEKKSAEAEYKKLKNSIFGHRRITMLHGKMKADEKDSVMQAFKAREYDILVSTTVVEVGVDVPNATVMLIESADTFGLSQLHQLRGRVGRGEHQSYCYLMMSDTKKPSQRLREVEKSNDGFYLAEKDMELRGPGEIYGRAQSGALDFEIARLSDVELISEVQKVADEWVDRIDELEEYPALVASIQKHQRVVTLN